jgi:prepilin-type processing-associated H-X9-DG protein
MRIRRTAGIGIPVQPPHDLRGDLPINAPNHWRLMLARHGRAINVGFADGSGRRVPLEDLYMFQWQSPWEKYSLALPPF